MLGWMSLTDEMQRFGPAAPWRDPSTIWGERLVFAG
jgi:hypothetical protein